MLCIPQWRRHCWPQRDVLALMEHREAEANLLTERQAIILPALRLLNRVEAGIRCFDPCLSCSTHAAGQMPLAISLVAADGRVLAERCRG